jgi:hypothetical protein
VVSRSERGEVGRTARPVPGDHRLVHGQQRREHRQQHAHQPE